MSANSYNFKLSYPQSTMVMGIIGILLSIYFLISQFYFPGLFFLIFSLPILLIRKGIRVNPVKNRIKPYLNFLGVEIGISNTYASLKGVKIVKTRTSQTVNSWVSSMRLDDSAYHAFLYYDSDKVLLNIQKDKSLITNKMRDFCKTTGIPLKE